MKDIARQLRETLETAKPRLFALSEWEASQKPYGEKWSFKELLGHLIDSASTNHQRIIRMQHAADIGRFGYEQEQWVKSQCYQDEAWDDIVRAWYYYNVHLAHVIEHVNHAALGNVCDMDYPQPATLEYVIKDYLKHMQHHLEQIFSGADPRARRRWNTTQ